MQLVSKQFGELRFSAMGLIMKKVEFVVVTVYLWHTEGFTERNNAILFSVQYFMKLIKLPVIIVGDFNITYETFENSDWCRRLGVVMRHPGVNSTTLLSNNRVIDFVLHSQILDELILDVLSLIHI